MSEVAAARDGCLVWLAEAAVASIHMMDNAPGDLPGRFVDFERVVWTLDKGAAPLALHALQRAQLLSVTDPDPLLSAIVTYIGDGLKGGAVEVVRELTRRGAELPHFGGGKAIANRLREMKETLRLIGIRQDESRDASTHLTFHMYRTKFGAESAQNAHSDIPTREKMNNNGHMNGEGFPGSANTADSAHEPPTGAEQKGSASSANERRI